MSFDLHNIPPIWTAIFHWFAYMLYILLLPKRVSGWKNWLVAGCFLAAQCVLYSFIGTLHGMAFNFGVALFAAWTLLPFAVLCRGGLLNHIYYCARAFILGGFVVSLAWQLYIYYSSRFSPMAGRAGEAVTMLLIAAAVMAVMYLLERTHQKELGEMPIPGKACAGTVIIALAVYILSSLSYTSLENPFTTDMETEAFNIRTIVYFGGVAILFALHLQLCDGHVRQERDALQRMLEMQYTNYQLSQDSIHLVNQKYHDLKHQIALLRSEITVGEKLECLDQMESEIRSYEAQNKTGNEVLDTILTGKSIYCQEHGITLTCVADGHALDFMSIMDISALFGNALDNAIEGVSKVPEAEQRLIHLSVSRQKGFLRIQVKNRCEEDLVTGEELPGTTKKDRRFHGYGLKSIRATAEKYGGSIAVHGENGWFDLGILIPLAPAEDRGGET